MLFKIKINVLSKTFCYKSFTERIYFQALDLWSLGCTLFAFVFGKLPFYDDSVLTLYNMIKTEPVSFPDHPKISDSLKDLIIRILDKDPSSRITLSEIKVNLNFYFILKILLSLPLR